jgi:hypothetical protein
MVGRATTVSLAVQQGREARAVDDPRVEKIDDDVRRLPRQFLEQQALQRACRIVADRLGRLYDERRTLAPMCHGQRDPLG